MYDTYPARLVGDENGEIIVSFRDVPEALTSGDGVSDAIGQAEDALIAALEGYIHAKRPIPRPSRPEPGEALVRLSVVTAAKLLLYDEMRAASLSKTALAQRLAVTEATVRRLLDLDHDSRIDLIDAALRQFGKRLSVRVEKAA